MASAFNEKLGHSRSGSDRSRTKNLIEPLRDPCGLRYGVFKLFEAQQLVSVLSLPQFQDSNRVGISGGVATRERKTDRPVRHSVAQLAALVLGLPQQILRLISCVAGQRLIAVEKLQNHFDAFCQRKLHRDLRGDVASRQPANRAVGGQLHDTEVLDQLAGLKRELKGGWVVLGNLHLRANV